MLLRHEGFRRLCRARDLLQEMREVPLSIEELAVEVRVSPSHFIKQFEAVFGVTPHQFRIQARLDLAKRLLARGEHSVTEVCMEVGFSSLGSFSTLFARRLGESPSAYQRRVRRLVQVPGIVPAELTPGCLTLMAYLPAGAFVGSAAAHRSFREAADGLIGHTAGHANQADEHHGGRSGQGAPVLYRYSGLQKKA